MRPDNDCSHGLAQISTMAPDGIRLQQAGLLRVLPAALEVLDNAHALGLLDTLPSNFHLVQCEKARIHSLREECPKALLYSQSALLLQSSKLECLQCLRLYVSSVSKQPKEQQQTEWLLRRLKKNRQPQVQELLSQVLQARQQLKYTAFLQSLARDGALFPKVLLVEGLPGYRKVITNTLVSKDDLLLFVPHSKMITLEIAHTLPLVERLTKEKVILRSNKHCLLSIFLLLHSELGVASPFSEYIKHLPHSYDFFPINYQQELLTELTGTSFLDLLDQKKADIQADYETLVRFEANFGRFSFAKFCEMRMSVSSRVFGVTIGGQRTDALVPLADMLNHSIVKQTSWSYCNNNKGFVIKALKSIPAGEQVCDSYGHKCNSRFLLHYGFTIPNNACNEVTIRIPIFGENRQVALLTVPVRVSRAINSKGFNEMMSALRYASSERGAAQFLGIDMESVKSVPFASNENEIAAWHLLASLVENQLDVFPTTLREDRCLLAGKHLHNNYVNCLTLRMGEKEVLLFYQIMARKILRYLQKGVCEGIEPYEPYLLLRSK